MGCFFVSGFPWGNHLGGKVRKVQPDLKGKNTRLERVKCDVTSEECASGCTAFLSPK